MALFEIKHRITGAVLYALDCGSLRACVEAAVRAGADLSGADLACADLSGANLSHANLAGASLTFAKLAGTNLTFANLSGADLACADLVCADLTCTSLAGTNLTFANLACANLAGASLTFAKLAGTDLIDAGQDRRVYRFWAWRDKDGTAVYCAGCHEWRDINVALAWYGEGYNSTGDRHECLARLMLLRDEAARRWPKEAA